MGSLPLSALSADRMVASVRPESACERLAFGTVLEALTSMFIGEKA